MDVIARQDTLDDVDAILRANLVDNDPHADPDSQGPPLPGFPHKDHFRLAGGEGPAITIEMALALYWNTNKITAWLFVLPDLIVFTAIVIIKICWPFSLSLMR